MNFKRALFVLLAGIFLQACAPTGPVKFYDGNKTLDQLARVKVPGPITVLKIDDSKIRSPSKEEGFYELHLYPGTHRITFKYQLYWGTVSDGMMIKSEPIAVTHNFVAGKVYELVYEKPDSESEAFEFTQEFQATLVESNGETRVASHSADKPPMPVASPTPTPGASQTPVVANPMPSAEQAANEDAVKRLKFWWLMAGEQEREEFRRWMQTEMPNFKSE